MGLISRSRSQNSSSAQVSAPLEHSLIDDTLSRARSRSVFAVSCALDLRTKKSVAGPVSGRSLSYHDKAATPTFGDMAWADSSLHYLYSVRVTISHLYAEWQVTPPDRSNWTNIVAGFVQLNPFFRNNNMCFSFARKQSVCWTVQNRVN